MRSAAAAACRPTGRPPDPPLAPAPALQCIADLEATLLAPPVNVRRASLHPAGVAPRIFDDGERRAHVLHRLRRQVEASGGAGLAALLDELERPPPPAGVAEAPTRTPCAAAPSGIAVPIRLPSPLGTLSFPSTTMVLGTAVDVTLAEHAIESLLPAGVATARPRLAAASA